MSPYADRDHLLRCIERLAHDADYRTIVREQCILTSWPLSGGALPHAALRYAIVPDETDDPDHDVEVLEETLAQSGCLQMIEALYPSAVSQAQ